MTPRADITLCGRLQVSFEGAEPVELSGVRHQAKLAFVYLVLNRRRPIGRDELIDKLWPEGGGDGERLVSPILSHLRGWLPTGVLPHGEPLQVNLAPSSTVDVEVAEAGIERAKELLGSDPALAGEAARAAAETFGRGFLPGTRADFVYEQRTICEERHFEALKLMVGAALAAGGGDLEQLAEPCRLLLTASPPREDHYELVMRVHAAAGRRALVAETSNEFRRRWSEEMPTPVPKALARLCEELADEGTPERGDGAVPPALRLALARNFVGREGELDRLVELWDGAPDRLSVILVAGEPGVGKTHLASYFAQWASGRRGRVLYGRCDEDSVLAYQPFLEALRAPAEEALEANGGSAPAELAHLALLFPELGHSEPGAGRISSSGGDPGPLFRSVAALLTRLARRRRVLLILDDMHWADQPTMHLLRILVRELTGTAVTIICTYRPDEVTRRHPFAKLRVDLGRDQGYHQIDLEGMNADEALELVRVTHALERSGSSMDDTALSGFAASLCDDTRGNPFFMTELLRAVGEDAVEISELEARRLDRLQVPFEVEDVIHRRLEHLSDEAQEAVADAAVLGLEFECWLLAHLRAGVSPEAEDAALSSLREAEDAGLVIDRGGGRFAFCHAIVRRTLDRTRGETQRARLHERAFAALQDGAASRRYIRAAEVAHHAFEARQRLDVRTVVEQLVKAAEEATKAFAYEDAIREYDRAAELLASSTGPEAKAQQARMLIRSGRARLRAGQVDANSAFRRAVEIARGMGDVDLQAAAVLGLAGRYYEARAREEDVVRLLEETLALGPAPEQRVRLLARLAEVLQFQGEPARSVALADEAMEIARSTGEFAAKLVADQARVVSRVNIGLHAERKAALSELLAGAQRIGHLELAAEAYHWLIYTEMEACRFDSARRAEQEMRTITGQLRQPLLEHLLATWKATFAGLEGRFAEAEQWTAEAHKQGRRAQTHEALSLYSAQLFNLRRDQGRVGDDLDTFELVAREYAGISAWRAILALAHLEAGDSATGRAHYEWFAHANFDNLPRNLYWGGAVGYLAEACWMLEDAEGAEVLHRLLLRYATHPSERRALLVSSASWTGSVDRFLGMTATVTGRRDQAAEHFERAATIEAEIGAQVPLVRTRLAYAACERLRGGAAARRRAEEQEQEAARLAARIGMPLPSNRGAIAIG